MVQMIKSINVSQISHLFKICCLMKSEYEMFSNILSEFYHYT
jgi:hypothetical protein